MRVDSMQIPSQGGLKIRTGADTFVSTLEEGDSIKAEALAYEKGAVIMKTDGGHTFRARLDPDVLLSAGDRVLLEMTGKEAGVVTLSIRGEIAEQFLQETGFEDKTLSAFAEKLAELNMPVNAETASLMRELMSSNPGMSPEEAAFLASNGLTGDESLINAALSLLSEGEKTDAMLERLLALILQPDAAEPLNAELRMQNAEFADGGHPMRDINVAQAVGDDAIIVQPRAAAANETGIAEWIALIKEGMPDAAKAFLHAEPPPSQAAGLIIPQDNSAMQNNLENNVEMLKNNIFADEQQPLIRDQGSGVRGQETGVARGETMSKAIAGLLSELHEFRGAGGPVLERFSDMLLRVAGDSGGAPDGDVGKLLNMLDNMFTRIARNDSDAGARLKNAKEELFARLMLLGEAISRAEPSAKSEMLDQTRKLMDHVRLLGSIDQFVYMQLPVQIGEERNTAELYFFKKKNNKKVDPENVNILLALDLENMGRWEGLINFRKKDVSIRMEVAGPKEKEHLSENTVLLHELLAEAGFKLVNTDIAYSEVETTPITALSVFDRIVSGRTGVVDFTI